MANILTQRILAIIRLLTRTLVGAVIGICVVAVYFGVDYLGATDKRLYWIDERDAIFTLLTMGVLIGATVGFIWAVSSKGRNKDGDCK